MNREEWKTVEGFPRYKISNNGRVKSCIKEETILIPQKIGFYNYVKLYAKDEEGKTFSKTIAIHRLVAKHFIENFSAEK